LDAAPETSSAGGHQRRIKERFSTYDEARSALLSCFASATTNASIRSKAEANVIKKYKGDNFSRIRAYLDEDGNVLSLFAYWRVVHDDIADIHFEKFSLLDKSFYVYVPAPRDKENIMLPEKERMLFYKVQRIIDEWDPLRLWSCGCPSSEYAIEAWEIYRILKGDERSDSLFSYFTALYDGSSVYKSIIEKAVYTEKVEQVVQELLEIVRLTEQ